MAIKYGNPWHCDPHLTLQCPVPGCTHKASILTKMHFRLEHGMERSKVEKKYGFPKMEAKKVLSCEIKEKLRSRDY